MHRKIILSKGKYVFYTSREGILHCDKVKEPKPWRSFLGDNAVCELFAYALKLEDRNAILERELSEQHRHE